MATTTTTPPATFSEISVKTFYQNTLNHRQGVFACLGQSGKRQPLVMLNTCIGYGADFTPAELRALAAKLNAIAAAGEVRPMGPRTFRPSYRLY